MKDHRTFPRWLCLGFAGLALATLASRAWMDIQQGTVGMVRWSEDWLLQAGVMTLPSLYVVLLSLGGGYCLKSQRRAVALILYAGVGTFLFFTSTNNLDFLANKTINAVEAEKAKATAKRDITEIQNEHALKDREEAKENLWRTYTTAKGLDNKAKALAEYKKFTEEPVPLKPLEVAPAKGGGDLLERWTGIKARTWAEAKTLALPLGFMVFEIVLLSLAISGWPRETKETPPTDPSNGESFKNNPQNPANLQVLDGGKVSSARRYELAEARRDLVRMLGEAPSVDKASLLSERWNWSLPTVLRQLDRWQDEGVCRTQRIGRDRVIFRPGPKAVSTSA